MFILSNLMHSVDPGFHTGLLAGRVNVYFRKVVPRDHLKCFLCVTFTSILLSTFCYPRRAWGATGIVVRWSVFLFVCLSLVYLLTWLQRCVYSMDSLYRTSSIF